MIYSADAESLADVERAGGVSLIYADPGWAYDQAGRGAAENHYTETPLERISALPVSRLAAQNAVLFMWGTWPQLPAVLAVGQDWGFKYKTVAFVWVKYRSKPEIKHIGGGFWTRANTEFCLLFVRGKNHPKRINKAIRQLIETDDGEKVLLAPLGKHSAKPPEARERIVQLMGDVPRIELFARCTDAAGKIVTGGRVAEGWAQWGDMCESDIQL